MILKMLKKTKNNVLKQVKYFLCSIMSVKPCRCKKENK